MDQPNYTAVGAPGAPNYAGGLVDFGAFMKSANNMSNYMKNRQQAAQKPNIGLGFNGNTIGPGTNQIPQPAGTPMSLAPPNPGGGPNYAAGMQQFMKPQQPVPYLNSGQMPVNQQFGGNNWGGAI